MKKDILNALGDNKRAYDSIMLCSKEPEQVKLRREVFVILKSKGYKDYEIAKFFGVRQSTVHKGLNEVLGYNRKDKFKFIKDELVRELFDANKGNYKAIYYKLKELGYSQVTIADHFEVSQSKVSKYILSYFDDKISIFRRKKIIRFR